MVAMKCSCAEVGGVSDRRLRGCPRTVHYTLALAPLGFVRAYLSIPGSARGSSEPSRLDRFARRALT